MSITPIDAIQLIAAEAVDSDTYDAWYKSICRWYSREFSTPLPQVEEMPEEEIFRVYYEDAFWVLAHGNEEQQNKFAQIVQDLMQRYVPDGEIAAIDHQDDDWYEQELAALDKKLAAKSNKAEVEDEGSLMSEPNLEDIRIHRDQEDDPIEDEGF